MHSKWVSRAVFALLFFVACTSCSRRDPVIYEKDEVICEYLPYRKKQHFVHREKKVKKIHKVDPTKEDFDAYQAQSTDFRLSIGDQLHIIVFGDKDTLVEDAIVAPDGYLYYLFLDGIKANGMTLKEVKEEIEEALKDFFIQPDISIIPTSISANTYKILGKVPRPGEYPITTSLTLRQAIGDAGGISLGGYRGTTINIASLRDSFLIRDGKRLNIDFENLLYTEGSKDNVFVRPNDYIYVASSLTKEVFLLGAVAEPKPIPFKDGLSVVSAIAGVSGILGGTTANADVTRALVVRGSLEQPEVYEVNLLDVYAGKAKDVYLLPGDIVYAQNKHMRFGRSLVRVAIEAFVRSFGGNAGEYVYDKAIKGKVGE